MPRKAIIEYVDVINGFITVNYFSEQNQQISVNIGIPTDEEGNYVKSSELIELVKKNYPEFNFKLKNIQRDSEELAELEALIDTELTIEKPSERSNSNVGEEKTINLDSRYGTKFEINNVKHIVLNTLIEMGLIK
jgi:hypothetical protein